MSPYLRTPDRGTPDKPRRFLVELRFMSAQGAGLDAVAFTPGAYGRLGPDSAERILRAQQASARTERHYHHVRIIARGSQVVVSEAGCLLPPA